MPSPKRQGFRLGIYVFKDAEIVDFAAPYGVFSVARRFDPELDAFLIADERGIKVTTAYIRSGAAAPAIRSIINSAEGEQTIFGTVFGVIGGERIGRIIEINNFRIEAIPRGFMLVMHNRDVPGVIGKVGTILGEAGINISAFHLGRRERGGEAMAVIEFDGPLTVETIAEIRSFSPIISARQIEL